MEFLRLLESIRNPVLDGIMLVLTEFGNEMLFIVFGMLMFWCVNKKQGYYILLTGFFGVYINQFLKIACRIPRPWVLDSNFTIVEGAREAATGYSFPSGHTQTAVGCFAGLAMCRKEKWVRAVGLSLAAVIPFTRMYLGVHTPYDVLVSATIALILVTTLWVLFDKFGDTPRLMVPLMGLLTLMGVAYLLYVNLENFPADIDLDNYTHALENGFKFLGCVVGMWVIYWVDRLFIRFETQTATWWAQVLKLVIGFALLVAILEGSKPLWKLIFKDALIAHTLRYLLTVLFAGAVWPLTFKWFAKLGAKQPKTTPAEETEEAAA